MVMIMITMIIIMIMRINDTMEWRGRVLMRWSGVERSGYLKNEGEHGHAVRTYTAPW